MIMENDQYCALQNILKYCQSIFDLHTPQSRPFEYVVKDGRILVDQQGQIGQ